MFFFYTGHVFAPYVFRAAKWAQSQPYPAVLIFLGWFAVNGLLVAHGLTFLPGMKLLLGYAGATAVMLLATLLCRLPWMSWLRYLGKRSIVVYLGFVIPLGLMRRFIASPTLDIDIGALSLGVAIAAIVGAMMLYWVIRSSPLRFIYRSAGMAVFEQAAVTRRHETAGGGDMTAQLIARHCAAIISTSPANSSPECAMLLA